VNPGKIARDQKTLEMATKLKETGNAEFKKPSYAPAEAAYSKAIRLVGMLKPPISEEQDTLALALVLSCHVHPFHLSQSVCHAPVWCARANVHSGIGGVESHRTQSVST
jgi:hypothetical protein